MALEEGTESLMFRSILRSLIKLATRVLLGMWSGPNSSSAVGSRKEIGGGTRSVLLLDKLLSDSSSAASETGVLGTGLTDRRQVRF
jgi:hypothetical protein